MMCVFCAAVPLATSVGMAITYKENEKKREMLDQGQVPPRSPVSPAKVTTAVVATLLVGSAIYHLAVGPRIGIY
jgi:hypothetical protein